MASPKQKFPGRHDELSAVARFLLSSYTRDETLFHDYSPDFDGRYRETFNNQITAVEAVAFPVNLTREGKIVTNRLVESLARLKKLVDLTEGYVKRAGSSLSVLPADFGCSHLRRKINRGDQEGSIQLLRTLLQNIDANLDPLKAKGFKEDIRNEMGSLLDSLIADNTAQNDNIQRRNQLVNDNVDLFDALFATMQDVSASGKVIHKTISGTPERMADYTLATLLKRVRQERRAQEGGGENPPAAGGG